MKKLGFVMIAMCYSFLLASSCSSDRENKEKGAIEKHNEKIAQEAVMTIKTPINEAKLAVEKENARNSQLEKQMKTQ